MYPLAMVTGGVVQAYKVDDLRAMLCPCQNDDLHRQDLPELVLALLLPELTGTLYTDNSIGFYR